MLINNYILKRSKCQYFFLGKHRVTKEPLEPVGRNGVNKVTYFPPFPDMDGSTDLSSLEIYWLLVENLNNTASAQTAKQDCTLRNAILSTKWLGPFSITEVPKRCLITER